MYYTRTVMDVREVDGERKPLLVYKEGHLVPGDYAFTYTHEGSVRLPAGCAKVRLMAVVHVSTNKVTSTGWSVVEYT